MSCSWQNRQDNVTTKMSSLYFFQARSQAEAREPGLQHYMGVDERNPDFVACKQQKRRPACASAKSDQRLCYSPSEK